MCHASSHSSQSNVSASLIPGLESSPAPPHPEHIVASMRSMYSRAVTTLPCRSTPTTSSESARDLDGDLACTSMCAPLGWTMASNGSLHSGHLVVTSAHRVMHVKQKVWCDVAWQPRSVDGSMQMSRQMEH